MLITTQCGSVTQDAKVTLSNSQPDRKYCELWQYFVHRVFWQLLVTVQIAVSTVSIPITYTARLPFSGQHKIAFSDMSRCNKRELFAKIIHYQVAPEVMWQFLRQQECHCSEVRIHSLQHQKTILCIMSHLNDCLAQVVRFNLCNFPNIISFHDFPFPRFSANHYTHCTALFLIKTSNVQIQLN